MDGRNRNRQDIARTRLPAEIDSVVVDEGDPLREYIPDTDNEAEKLHPRDIVPNLSDDPVQYEKCLNSLTQQESASP